MLLADIVLSELEAVVIALCVVLAMLALYLWSLIRSLKREKKDQELVLDRVMVLLLEVVHGVPIDERRKIVAAMLLENLRKSRGFNDEYVGLFGNNDDHSAGDDMRTREIEPVPPASSDEEP